MYVCQQQIIIIFFHGGGRNSLLTSFKTAGGHCNSSTEGGQRKTRLALSQSGLKR